MRKIAKIQEIQVKLPDIENIMQIMWSERTNDKI